MLKIKSLFINRCLVLLILTTTLKLKLSFLMAVNESRSSNWSQDGCRFFSVWG